MKVDAKIYQTDLSGSKIKTSISYIKPTATNEKIITLAKAINDLSTNTYLNTHRLEDKELAEEE